jgi:hypothetical protein
MTDVIIKYVNLTFSRFSISKEFVREVALPVSLDGAGELSVSGEYSSLPALYKSQI